MAENCGDCPYRAKTSGIDPYYCRKYSSGIRSVYDLGETREIDSFKLDWCQLLLNEKTEKGEQNG